MAFHSDFKLKCSHVSISEVRKFKSFGLIRFFEEGGAEVRGVHILDQGFIPL